ncbi:putative bifunctional diguanylate cyclase/phosphodiesterase [Paractinoplanes atraurantiacus]|uniref:PAS domain S-box-containing protein/diguanylate cyclase (GGDEF) domain-containing protein n=1 Tax=Paractinoplanes atraurantiacus TaxID=1036182 RepID=A0A285H5N1_9ACTN|nr:EAL domain-containing protein [Actinoplanes atraurantiacus]SNY30106.1 PAS domain S-box-containing protein/diguanylate cyclase (GGDEF) domain-containing protein [Actinoplanes atraurantiacus]
MLDTPGRPPLFADRAFQAVTALLIVNVAAFLLQEHTGPLWPAPVNWLLVIAVIVPTLLLCRRARTDPESAPVVRRYWRTMTIGISLFVGVVALRVLSEIGLAGWLLPASVVLHVLAGAVLTWPLVGLPLSARDRMVGVWLDLGTLSAAAGLLIWHFAAAAQFADGRVTLPRVLAAAVIMGAGLNGVHLAAKVVLAGVESFARRGLYWIGASGLIGGLGSAISFLHPHQPSGNLLLLVLPFAAYAAAAGARVQVVDTAAGARERRVRRGYSLMPYMAIAAVDAMVVINNVRGTGDGLLIDSVAVVLTALVVIRQLIAFRQNDTLLARIGVQEERFRRLVQNSTDMVTIAEPGGALTYVSPAARGVLGADPAGMIGTDMMAWVHPDDLAAVTERIATVTATPGTTTTYQARLRHDDGTYRWLEIISANLTGEPSVGGIVSNARDITETRQVQDRLSYEASHDMLTGLANRALFHERVTAAIRRAGPDERFSIVLVDLDDFKTVNDTLGHATGDALLVHVAERMRASVRPVDTVARLGGDEFAILFEGVAGEDVERMLVRIAAALLEPALVDRQPLTARASFGVVDGHAGDDAGDLLRQADIAMYEAKGRGEGGYERYRPEMEARGAERSRQAAALRTAIIEDQLVVHFQPVVTLPEGRITGAEALVRWQHPVDGLLGPGAFIDTAEQTGLIVPLGVRVLRAATREAATWPGELTVSVNVSARQLREAGFPAVVEAALRESGLPARRLTVEITESVAVGGGATTENLQGLRDLGVRLSLDDFGTGASTLSLLATCPVHQIKLDRSFVPDGGSDAIARAVAQMARAFGLQTVAEGVETAEQAALMTRLGYERAQGFHFARPMSAADLRARLGATAVRS